MWRFHMTSFPKKIQKFPQSGYVPLNVAMEKNTAKQIFYITM